MGETHKAFALGKKHLLNRQVIHGLLAQVKLALLVRVVYGYIPKHIISDI